MKEDIQRSAPIGLGDFSGPRIIGKTEMPKVDLFDEHALVTHRGSYRPVSIRFQFSKEGEPLSAYFVTPVARVKVNLNADGSAGNIRLVVHSHAQGQPYEGQIILKAAVVNGEPHDIKKFVQYEENRLDGAWMPVDSKLDGRSHFEMPMLMSHLRIYKDISEISIPDIARTYRSN